MASTFTKMRRFATMKPRSGSSGVTLSPDVLMSYDDLGDLEGTTSKYAATMVNMTSESKQRRQI